MLASRHDGRFPPPDRAGLDAESGRHGGGRYARALADVLKPAEPLPLEVLPYAARNMDRISQRGSRRSIPT